MFCSLLISGLLLVVGQLRKGKERKGKEKKRKEMPMSAHSCQNSSCITINAGLRGKWPTQCITQHVRNYLPSHHPSARSTARTFRISFKPKEVHRCTFR